MKPMALLSLVLAVIFTAVGCEKKLTISSVEHTQSLNEAAPADVEDEELGVIIERNVPVPTRMCRWVMA